MRKYWMCLAVMLLYKVCSPLSCKLECMAGNCTIQRLIFFLWSNHFTVIKQCYSLQLWFKRRSSVAHQSRDQRQIQLSNVHQQQCLSENLSSLVWCWVAISWVTGSAWDRLASLNSLHRRPNCCGNVGYSSHRRTEAGSVKITINSIRLVLMNEKTAGRAKKKQQRGRLALTAVLVEERQHTGRCAARYLAFLRSPAPDWSRNEWTLNLPATSDQFPAVNSTFLEAKSKDG